jgi:hypothetical protein
VAGSCEHGNERSCMILGNLGGECDECRVLGCDTAWFLLEPIFRTKADTPSSR